ncbi:phage antirepressor KilAC domain-containing protein [Alkanindiges illinoisensis]|uniref:phage antirepressor KilAC domain-containing protein n=1 Tax=Alkanindiges illinoisensis TaxID=197183 RepID=UPI000683E637|nr:phage regulatory protein/antirepressor Ant [Alkanindiges illinoisensis]
MAAVAFNPLNAGRTMSSREIAELTRKEHGHMMRDIKSVLTQLGFNDSQYIHYWIHPQNYQQYPEYQLDHQLTMILITGYSVPLRAAVINRWSELEQRNLLPDFTDPAATAIAWAEQYRLKQQAEQQIAQLVPKAEALDRITNTADLFGIREACNALKISQTQLTTMLIECKWAFRTPKGKLQGYANRTKQGVLTHIVTQPKPDNHGVEHVYQQLKITSKGITVLAEILEKEGSK